MIRATLDANVVASGVLGIERAESAPGAIMRLWHRRTFEFITADPLIAEIERTLRNAYFAPRISARQRDLTITSLKRDATWTEITVVVSGSPPTRRMTSSWLSRSSLAPTTS